jgi:hypothetical protein
MGRKRATEPLAGFTMEESEMIRAYRRKMQKRYMERKTPDERAKINNSYALSCAKKSSENDSEKG